MAFAKKLYSDGYQKRMLNLITGQVSHRAAEAASRSESDSNVEERICRSLESLQKRILLPANRL